jgi:hypothetical protein
MRLDDLHSVGRILYILEFVEVAERYATEHRAIVATADSAGFPGVHHGLAPDGDTYVDTT